jgi:phage terminase large subunit
VARVVEIPYKPRNWAKSFHESLQRFAAIILHRRAGKTTCVVNHHLRAALDDDWEKRRLLHLRPSLTERDLQELVHPVGGRHYGHVMPTRVQAKMVVWDKLKHYARDVKATPNESELLLKLPNGNKIQLFGADDPDAMRGPAFSGLSFDEYSQQPRNIFSEVLSKALADHLGYAVFLGTIKGQDHLYATYQAAKGSDEWFSLWQDVDKSLATEDGITVQLLQQAMEDDRKQIEMGLMSQAEFEQEWFLSPEAAIKGSYYGEILAQLRKSGHITRVPYDATIPVDTDWDLGIDAMAIWFTQTLTSGEIRVIDYHEDVGGGLKECINMLKSKPYMYGQHWGPHDIETREISSGLTRRQIARSMGVEFRVTPKLEVQDGINAVQHYRKTYNQRLDQYTATPLHDANSHGADAFRGFAVRYRQPDKLKPRTQDLRDLATHTQDTRTNSGNWMH